MILVDWDVTPELEEEPVEKVVLRKSEEQDEVGDESEEEIWADEIMPKEEIEKPEPSKISSSKSPNNSGKFKITNCRTSR